jgi:hypothetical protein
MGKGLMHSQWSETRRCFITISFQLCFRICHQVGPRKQGLELNGTQKLVVYADYINILGEKNRNSATG